MGENNFHPLVFRQKKVNRRDCTGRSRIVYTAGKAATLERAAGFYLVPLHTRIHIDVYTRAARARVCLCAMYNSVHMYIVDILYVPTRTLPSVVLTSKRSVWDLGT